MAQRTTNRTTPPTPSQRQAQRQTRRLNRAEQQAMDIRESRTITGTGVVEVPRPVIADRPTGAVATARTRRRRETGPAARVNTLTREQEYGFIRMDLRRLLLLSAALIVVMVVVLFAIESIV